VRYRLLETMRAYALAKLAETGELNEVARRHAKYFRDLFQRAETEWETRPTAEWLEDYGRRIDNVRAALDWAFSADGDAVIGVALTVAAVPLWLQLSLLEECHDRVEQALARLGNEASPGTRRHIQLFLQPAKLSAHEIGPRREIKAAWTKVFELAESLNDTDYKMRALWGLWVSSINGGEYRAALAFAQRFRSLAAHAADPTELLIGDRLVGNSLYYLGDQTDARRHIEHMLSRYAPPVRGRMSFAFTLISGWRRRPFSREYFGSRDFRIKPCAPLNAVSRTLKQSITHFRCVSRWRSGCARLRSRSIGTRRGNAARSHDKACAGLLARLGPGLQRGAADQARRRRRTAGPRRRPR
jgi:hypothetical protein